jgi:RND family efflux transporter MFP subunit
MMSRYFAAFLLVAVGAASVLVYQRVMPAGEAGPGRPGGGPPGGFRPGGGRGAFGAQPMRVDSAGVARADIAEQLQLVGNLTGAASVEVAPKINGRLRQVDLRLGDPVTRGQEVARVEDDELRQQVSQAEASHEVARATVRQREADLLLARTTRDRSQSLFSRALVSRQELDDAEARYQAANAQLDLARAQFDEAGARLQELRINLENTVMVSPVDGFIGRRYLDPGAYVTSNTAVVSVVDISLVRLVVNLVERDLQQVEEGVRARIEVDAFPSESFEGRVARIAPVLDPATRTAEIEIEVPNPDFRLKPGMYARVSLVVGNKSQALVVPREAIVLRTSARGVFRVESGDGAATAQFVSLVTGLEDEHHVEVVEGLLEGEQVVTTGAAGLQHGDPILLAGAGGGRPGQGGFPGPGGSPRRGGPPGAIPDGGLRPASGRGESPGAVSGRASARGDLAGVPARQAPASEALEAAQPSRGRAVAGDADAVPVADRDASEVREMPSGAAVGRETRPRNTVLEALGIAPAPAQGASPAPGR